MKFELSDLHESNKFLNTVLDNIHSAVFITDTDLKMSRFNDPFLKLFQPLEKELIGKMCGETIGCMYCVEEGKECGHTSSCDICQIRSGLISTFKDKEPVTKVQIDRSFYIDGKKISKHFQISTRNISFRAKPMILVIIDDISELVEKQTLLEENNKLLLDLNNEMDQDLRMAAQSQQSTMSYIGTLPWLKSALLFEPYQKVSGDFLEDIIEDNDTRSIFLGDATGHGTSAALLTMMAKMALQNCRGYFKVKKVMTKLNEELAKSMPSDRFITGLFMRISSDGTLTVSSAGHPPVIVIPSDGKKAFLLEKHGLPLGLMSPVPMPFTMEKIKLSDGDKIFLFTDGITECRSGNSEFGIERLIACLEKTRDLSLKEQLNTLMDHLTRFSGSEDKPSFRDDATMLALEFLGE